MALHKAPHHTEDSRSLRIAYGFKPGLGLLLLLISLVACNRFSMGAPDQEFKQARATFERGDLPSALDLADKSYRKFERKSPQWSWRFRVLKAEVFVWQGKSKDALALLQPNLPAGLAPDIAIRRKIVQGLAYCYLQRFDESLTTLADAQQLAESSGHVELLADINLAKGTLANVRNDFPAARTLYLDALQAAKVQNRIFLQANALGNLGWASMRNQRYDEAINWFSASLTVSQQLKNETQIEKIMGNMGWCYFRMGDFERALSNFTESETAAARLGIARDQLLWLTNIGSIHYQQRDYVSAAGFYKRALVMARELENKSAAQVALNNLASTALDTGNYDLAEKYNHEALQLAREIGDTTGELYPVENDGRIAAGRKNYSEARKLFDRVIRESGENASLRWEAQSELAEMYLAQGNAAQADSEFKRALATIDKARATLKEEHRLSFLGSAQRFYDDYIEFLVSHKREREALQVAEHSRARTLAEGLGLAKREAAFHPEQTARSEKSVILYYWLGAERSYLWAISPTKLALFRLPAAADLDAKVQSYQKALMGPRDVRETQNSIGQDLYTTLVAPAQKMIPANPRVIVIPDGSLHGLNFETLLVPAPQLHYWIEDATITNGNSLSLLGVPERTAPARNLLLIGDPVYTGRDFPPLPQAKVELADVEQHFPATERTVLSGDQATAQAYEKSDAGKYAYIHFVAHATSSRISPLDSGIILSNDGGTTKLYARDIMQQPLHASLVTVAACYGAGTRAYSGEGLVGLSWAFLRAGAHNVIAALWEVNDASTPQLMDTLYTELGKGSDPATALRDAKLKLLHSDSVFRRPFYWGAFQLYSGS